MNRYRHGPHGRGVPPPSRAPKVPAPDSQRLVSQASPDTPFSDLSPTPHIALLPGYPAPLAGHQLGAEETHGGRGCAGRGGGGGARRARDDLRAPESRPASSILAMKSFLMRASSVSSWRALSYAFAI